MSAFIEIEDELAGLAAVSGWTQVSAHLSVPIYLSAMIAGRTLVSSQLTGGNVPVDVFGKTTVFANLSNKPSLSATISGSTALSTFTVFENFDPFTLLIAVALYEQIPLSTESWLPRLLIDGVEIAVTGGNVAGGSRQSGRTVNCRITDIKDRAAIESALLFDFGIGNQSIYDVWDEDTMEWFILDGSLVSIQDAIGANGRLLTDTYDITIKDQATDRLATYPQTSEVFFNSDVTSVNEDDFEILLDSVGNEYPTEVHDVPGMTLYDMFDQIYRDRCGFTGVKKNIPDYPLTRVDCPIGRSYFESTAGYYGHRDPQVFDLDDYLWIVDTTAVMPAGFPAPIGITVEDYRTLQINQERLNLDGAILTYVENSREYDYVTASNEAKVIEYGSVGDPGYVSLTVDRGFREYRKFSRPGVILKKELYREIRTTQKFGGTTIEETRETKSFDSQNRTTARSLEVRSLEPDVSNPDGGNLKTTQLQSLIDETYEYAGHPFQPRQEYLRRKTVKRSGLVIIDANQQQLGADFVQEYKVASRFGNLRDGQTTDFVDIDVNIETIQPLQNGLVRKAVYQYNYLTEQVELDGVPEDLPGDVSISAIGPAQKEMLVLKDDAAVRTTRALGNFHGGEESVITLVPLVRRLAGLQNQAQRTISADYIGFNKAIKKGLPVTVQRRNAETVGTFMVIGIDIPFNSGGCSMQLELKELHEVEDYIFGDENPIGSFSIILESEQAKTINVQIQCKAGYVLKSSVAPSITVEAKRTSEMSWTDIEGGTYDLTPYDETTQDFQIRLTAGTLTGDSQQIVEISVEVP